MVGEVFTLGDLMEGYESSSSYATTSFSTTLSAVGGEGFALDELGFYVHTAGSYELWLDGILVASLTAPTRNAIYRFTGIATPLQSQMIDLVIRSSTPATFRAVTRTETTLGHGVTVGRWQDYPVSTITVVMIFEIVVTRTKDAVPEWAQPGLLDPDGDGMSRVARILSRRERIPAYQASGVAGAGGDDVEPATGQVWPR